MKKRPGYSLIYNTCLGSGRRVYIDNNYYLFFENIKKSYRSSYHKTSLYRAVIALNSDAYKGPGLNIAGNLRVQATGGGVLEYYIDDGDVLINELALDESEISSEIGLHAVTFRGGDWITQENKEFSLDGNQQWTDTKRKQSGGKAHYAAVSGKFANEGIAGTMLGSHIANAYHKADCLSTGEAKSDGNQYSLFFTPKGRHKSSETANELASVIQQASKSNIPVNWLIHGEGAFTFEKASAILKVQPLASTTSQKINSMYANGPTGQKVYFSNPKIASTKKLENMCNAAGMEYAGSNPQYRDLRSKHVYRNAALEISKKVAKYSVAGTSVGVGGVVLKEIGLGSATKLIPVISQALSSGNVGVAVAASVTLGFGAHAALTKSSGLVKMVRATAKATFGRGNEYWYVDDETLISDMTA